nr:propionyl-CoA carboxylase [Nannocystis sp.]
MAHVPLIPIGTAREQLGDDRTYQDHRAAVAELEATLRERRAGVHAGWGEKYAERVRARGKLTARDRLARLIDPGSRVYEVGTFVNDGVVFGDGLRSPAAGVVTAFAMVEGRWCMV